jgi:hypothetical protein
MDQDLINVLEEVVSDVWERLDDELQLPVAGQPGMMHASVRVDDGTVFVTEFEGWGIAGEYRFSGSPSIMGPRVAAVLDAIAEERA